MSYIETIIINCIYILFPLFLYFLYFAYTKAFDKNTIKIVLNFCVLSSFYLVLKFGPENMLLRLLFLNIPIVLSYYYNKKMSSILLSIYMIIIYSHFSNSILMFMVLEYTICFLLKYAINSSKIHVGIFIIIQMISILILKNYFNIFKDISVNDIVINFIVFTLTNLICLFSLKKIKEIVKLEMTMKELKKEEQIRTSLFKITHEIKNPIAVCKGYLDMFDINNKDHARKYIPIIRSEINRTLILLQDFLDCNHLKINKDILDINMLLSDVEEECRPLINSKRINFISNIDYDDELYLEGDYERLKQVLVNVIKNSIEAIKVKSDSYIELNSDIINNKVHIIIEDNGEGIKKEDLKKIKQPFYTTKKDGTGLGVTLSYEIIKAHSGTINYTSVYHKWTKVEIVLPLNKIEF